ncbi:MAG: glycosyltransferase [Flavobacteriales bacterium]
MGSERPKVLVFIDHFLPGYKAGGPVRSCANMIERLKDRARFLVITSDREYMEDSPYPDVERDRWNERDHGAVFYASPASQTASTLKRSIEEVDPDVVYINGIYSYRFSILPLRILKKERAATRVVVAPRGMLAPGAMSVKPLKKRLFLTAARLMGLFNGVKFHATKEEERDEIHRWIGGSKVQTVPNLPPSVNPGSDPGIEKKPGALRLVSIARIAPEKNTLGLLGSLESVNEGSIDLDLCGPVYDEKYWERCKKVIDRMPDGIRVRHIDGVPPDRTASLVRDHHAFILFTKGENFGHAIMEALLAGRPVIISNRTPWKNVEDKGVGRLVDLEDLASAGNAIREFLDMEASAYEVVRGKVRSYAERIHQEYALEENYEKLFFS